MPEVLIRCPVTGRLLTTGIALDVDCFQRADLREQSISCPFCGQQHTWRKEDAFLRRE
jgi:hypothetical protein